ncbi:MAG: hypothetical protein EZS28_016279, partial [Streblomastix strix]
LLSWNSWMRAEGVESELSTVRLTHGTIKSMLFEKSKSKI